MKGEERIDQGLVRLPIKDDQPRVEEESYRASV